MKLIRVKYKILTTRNPANNSLFLPWPNAALWQRLSVIEPLNSLIEGSVLPFVQVSTFIR
jgi:hypothetical protein